MAPLKLFVVTLALLSGILNAHSQKDTAVRNPAETIEESNRHNSEQSQIKFQFEFRPRTEFRYGYRQLRPDSASPSVGTSHRLRLNLVHESPSTRLVFSIQDVRVWGEDNTRDTRGWLQVFEAYAEFRCSKKSRMRIGRQTLSLGNQRLLAANNWRQTGGKHDLLRWIRESDSTELQAFGAYNRDRITNFNDDFDVAFPFYKSILGLYCSWKEWENLNIEYLGFLDTYEEPLGEEALTEYGKFTGGLRLISERQKVSADASGYVQVGQNARGKKHEAWLLDANVCFDFTTTWQSTFGLQVFSGDNNPNDDRSSAFLAQYGAFHRNNGKMDYTSRMVWTDEHPGIINPFLVQRFQVSDRFTLIVEEHLLGTTTPDQGMFLETDDSAFFLNYFYAAETDLICRLELPNSIKLHIAYMTLLPQEAILAFDSSPLNLGEGNKDRMTHFAYVQLTYKPKSKSLRR